MTDQIRADPKPHQGRTVVSIAGGEIDPDRPRLKHRPNAKFQWQIVRGNEHIRLNDRQMHALFIAYLEEAKADGT